MELKTIRIQRVVEQQNLASVMKSGSLDVLATPQMPVGVDVHPAVLRVEQHLPFAVERIPLDRLFAHGKDPGVHIIKEHIEFLGRVVPPGEGLFGVAEVFLEAAEEVVPLRQRQKHRPPGYF